MNKKFLYIILIIFSIQTSFGQGIFSRKSPTQKAANKTRKLNKKNNQIPFNEELPQNYRPDYGRIDFIWSSETAYTGVKKSGDISLTTPSRFNAGNNFEFSTLLPLNYFVPNLMLKKSYTTKRFLLAHRHALYSSTLGLKWAQQNGYETIVSSSVQVPFIMSIRNEFIASYPIGADPICSNGQPFLIITGGVAVDVGVPFEKNNLTPMNEHFFGSRSPSLTGKGAHLSTRLRVDGRLTNSMYVEGDIKFFYGKFFQNNFAMEQHTGLQLFLVRNTSFTIGYAISYGHFTNKNFFIMPTADLTYYFGTRLKRDVGLFGKGR
ncbi:MAG: hypothetical protein FWH18_08710 [Marinilabiliaceae bacterium]|nr:hypothetical protein [Marinilabiliaceae bacterium]